MFSSSGEFQIELLIIDLENKSDYGFMKSTLNAAIRNLVQSI